MPSRTANDSYSGVAVGVLAIQRAGFLGVTAVEGERRAWTNISSF
jgi:hypothetical protein